MNEPNKHKLYLQDLGLLVKERARAARAKRKSAKPGSEEASISWGELLALYGVVTTMQQQAESFNIPLEELRLDDIDPDRELL